MSLLNIDNCLNSYNIVNALKVEQKLKIKKYFIEFYLLFYVDWAWADLSDWYWESIVMRATASKALSWTIDCI